MQAPVVDGNPNTYPLDGLIPGTLIVDMSGAISDRIAVVVRSGPTTNARLILAGGAALAADSIALVQSSTGAGNRTLQFTVTQNGSPRASVRMLLSLTSTQTVTDVTATVGTAVSVGTATGLDVVGRANGSGVWTVSITDTTGATLTYDATSVSATPGAVAGTASVP